MKRTPKRPLKELAEWFEITLPTPNGLPEKWLHIALNLIANLIPKGAKLTKEEHENLFQLIDLIRPIDLKYGETLTRRHTAMTTAVDKDNVRYRSNEEKLAFFISSQDSSGGLAAEALTVFLFLARVFRTNKFSFGLLVLDILSVGLGNAIAREWLRREGLRRANRATVIQGITMEVGTDEAGALSNLIIGTEIGWANETDKAGFLVAMKRVLDTSLPSPNRAEILTNSALDSSQYSIRIYGVDILNEILNAGKRAREDFAFQNLRYRNDAELDERYAADREGKISTTVGLLGFMSPPNVASFLYWLYVNEKVEGIQTAREVWAESGLEFPSIPKSPDAIQKYYEGR